MFTYLTAMSSFSVLALVAGGVACAPAPTSADDVSRDSDAAEAPPEPPPEGDASPEPPSDEPSGDDPPSEEPPSGDPPAEEPPSEEPPPPPPEPVQLPPSVSHGEVSFINGEVPHVDKFLAKRKDRVAQCIVDHGGMKAAQGTLEMQFLVRVRGRAEGVEVLKRTAVSEEAARCVRVVLKNEWVGTPTSDPTGVQFTYELERRLER